MMSIIILSLFRYVIIAGILGVLGFSVSIPYSILILGGLVGVELNTEEPFTAIYLNTKQEEE